jgi:hypothetical protein
MQGEPHVIKKLFFPTLALSILVASGPAARAATVSHFSLRGRALTANFETASDDGCVVAQTALVYGEFVTQTDGAPIVLPPNTQLQIDYANACTGDVLSLSGGTTTQTVQILGDLSSATLSATIPVTDGVNSATVSVNLTLTANGDVQVAKGHFRTSDGNATTMDNFDLKLRNADDAGSFTTTLPLSTGPTAIQLAQYPEGGTIGSDMEGSRTVVKKN